MGDENYQEKFNQILACFRNHKYSGQKIQKDVEQPLKEVRSAKKSQSL